MGELLARLMRGRGVMSRLTARKCRGCEDPSFHTAHLTWFGRRRYVAAKGDVH